MNKIILILFVIFTLLPKTIKANYDGNTDNVISQEDIYIKIMILKKYIGASKAEIISKYFKESIQSNNLSINVVLSIAYIESGFNQGARGTLKDTGIMQIMPFWKDSKLCNGLRLWHSKDNIECGCRILKHYIDMFNGNVISGVTAYNMGSYAVIKFNKRNINMRKHINYPKIIFNFKELLDSFDQYKKNISEEDNK